MAAWLITQTAAAVHVERQARPAWVRHYLHAIMRAVGPRLATHARANVAGARGTQLSTVFYTCAEVEVIKPVAKQIAAHIESINDGIVTFPGGGAVGDLRCIGAGGAGVTYSATYSVGADRGTVHPAVVKFAFEPSAHVACRYAKLIDDHAAEGLTGSQSFVKAFAWGTWAMNDSSDIPFEVWEKVDGHDLQVVYGEVHHEQKTGFVRRDITHIRYIPTSELKTVAGSKPLQWKPKGGKANYRISKNAHNIDRLRTPPPNDRVSGVAIGKEWVRVELPDPVALYTRENLGFKHFFGENPLGEEATARECQKQLLEAVIFLWSLGLKHSDIQRSNAMWTKTGRLKLVDYDLMRHFPGFRDKQNTDAHDAMVIMYADVDWAPIEISEAQTETMLDMDFRFEKKGKSQTLAAFTQMITERFPGGEPITLATEIQAAAVSAALSGGT